MWAAWWRPCGALRGARRRCPPSWWATPPSSIWSTRRPAWPRGCCRPPRARPSTRGGATGPRPPLLERRHHLLGHDAEAPHRQPRRDEASRVRLDDDPVEPELLLERAEAIDQRGGRPEHHPRAADLVVGHALEPLEPGRAPVVGARSGAAEAGLGELGVALEEVGDALARVFQGALLRLAGIDGQAEIDAGAAGLSRLAPGAPVAAQLGLQLGDVQIAQAHEQRQPGLGHLGEGLGAIGGHSQRRMRVLERARRHHRVLELVEVALVAEGLTLPGLADDLEGLAEARLALAIGNAEHVVGARRAAPAYAHVEAALAELVDSGRLLPDAQGMAQRQGPYRGAPPDPAGAAGNGGGHDHLGGD